MEVFYSGAVLPYSGCAVALGEFDGLHRAHMKIISAAEQSGLPFGVMYFSQNPKQGVSRLMSETQKKKILSGCDFVYVQDFTEEFRSKSCEEFARFLSGTLHARAVFAGYNYSFGKNAAGDAELLKELGSKYGFSVNIIPEFKLGGESVSSSAIREYIKDGLVDRAAYMLGRPYCIDGAVIHGKHNGHKMGFPTVNIDYEKNMTFPKRGVYAGYTIIGGERYKSVINVGKNPTFGAQNISVESHITGFSRDVYGEYAEIEFVKFIRSEKRFESAAELAAQIEKDKTEALCVLQSRL